VQIPWLDPPDTSTGGTRVLVPEAPWRARNRYRRARRSPGAGCHPRPRCREDS